MTIGQLLSEAASLMVTGMLFVFAFLTLLIFSVQGIARFCQRFPGAQPGHPSANRARANQKAVAPDESDNDVIAAITAAVHQYRQSNKK